MNSGAPIGKVPSRRMALGGVLLLLCTLAFNLCAQKQIATPPETLSPEESARLGRALVNEILAARPTEDATTTCVMTIRDAKNKRTQFPVKFQIIVTPTNWISVYDAGDTAIKVNHYGAQPNRYEYDAPNGRLVMLSGNQAMYPFAGSDFWLADLGLEFFHWPEQHVIKKEMKRSRACQVLESINPQPAPGAYSHVVSWIDNESHAIVMAQAYDSNGRLLKKFIPTKVEKIQGQWQLQEMEIDNEQTGSDTRVDFNLNRS